MRKGGIRIPCLVLFMALGLTGVSFVAPVAPICQIQGSGFSSPIVGQTIHTQGVVTADFDETSAKGFYIQAENCDTDPATSNGFFIDLGERLDVVSMGDFVEVNSTGVEDFGFTKIDAASSAAQVLSDGHVLPVVLELNPPFDNIQVRTYFETLEGMLTSVLLARIDSTGLETLKQMIPVLGPKPGSFVPSG